MRGARPKSKAEAWGWSHALIYLGVPILIAALHGVCLEQYGFFRDELYYLACAKHMAWGYVDHPPLSIGVLRLFVDWLGSDLWVVRLPGVIAASLGSVFAALAARRIGGGVYAQGLTAIAFALTPVYLVVGHMYSMNSLDLLIWPLAAYLYACLLKKPNGGLWLILGVVLGAAILNKLSGFWLIGGLGLGLLLTDQRKQLKTPWPWLAVLIALGVAAPHFWWQYENGWASFEFLRNAYDHKLVPQHRGMMLAVQSVVMNPLALPLWLLGLGALLWQKDLKPFRGMAVAFLFVFALVVIAGKARPNYMAPAFVMLLAPAAVYVERLGDAKGWGWTRPVLTGLMVMGGVVLVPLSLPMLPAPVLERVISTLGVEVPSEEEGPKSKLQGFADMFGWPELAGEVKRVVSQLDPGDLKGCAVIAPTYGEAAALEHFWPDAPVPILSGHNNYWLWGHEGWDGHCAILIRPSPSMLARFSRAEQIGQVRSPYAVPSLNGSPIYVVHGLRSSVDEFWAEIKEYE